jgi:anti-sigma factor RsiW
MSCRPELVTGLVDGALDDDESASVAAHLRECAPCREQAEAERLLRAKLRELPSPEPGARIERRVRASLLPRRTQLLRVLLPLAAALALLALWLRTSPAGMAHALALDHMKCFRHARVPAKVFADDGRPIVEWFAAQGTPMPRLPSRPADLALLGARYCPLVDGSSVPHVYYRDGGRNVSLFVVSRRLGSEAPFATTALGRNVRLVSHGDQTLGVVGESASDVEAVGAALVTRAARLHY